MNTKVQKEKVYADFYSKVNMTPTQIEKWLETSKSKSVGKETDDGETVGRRSAKKIIAIKRTKKDSLKKSQYDHMNKVCGYIARHTAQRPSGDVKESNWRYSLKNWGHDPLKN